MDKKIAARFTAVASGLAIAFVAGPALGGAVKAASYSAPSHTVDLKVTSLGGTGTSVAADEDHGDRDRDRDRDHDHDRGRGDEAQVTGLGGTQMLIAADEDRGDRDRDRERGDEGHDHDHEG